MLRIGRAAARLNQRPDRETGNGGREALNSDIAKASIKLRSFLVLTHEP